MIGITKIFPGIIANDNINLTVRENEVLALLGENGAGKSTLMSILFGSYDPDQGIIKIRGKEVKIKDPNAATALGIGMVHQHFKLIHNYTVAENIVLGIEPRNKFGLIDLAAAEKRVAELSEQYGLMVNPKAKIEDITVSPRVVESLEITKAPSKTSYVVGQSFDPTGLEALARFDKGDDLKLDASELAFAPETFDASGSQEVTATYTYDGDTGTFAWTTTGDKRDFSETFNVTLNNSEGENTQPITDEKPETTFMMIPQTLEGVTVEVGVTTSEGSFTLTGSLAQTGAWEAGKIYTYAISTESINWVYEFEVTSDITLALGETQKTYNVKSYRYRRGNYNERQPVAWSAVNTACTETDFGTKKTENKNWSDIQLAFTDTGAGSADEAGTNHSIQVIETILHTTYDGDKQLQDESKAKGTPEKPYNLATDNGEDGAMTTANCYVVNAVGTYKLPLVYGNGLKNGAKNNPAFNGNFKDYQNNTITDPWIKGTDNCCLVWSDGFYMFKNVHKEGDYLVFTLDPNYTQQANAVLAVRDASNNIMWSWHIWVTDRNVNETYDVKGWNESTHYYLMSYNLGWIDGKQVYYNQRNFAFTFTQNGTGTVRTLNVVQKGDHFDYKDAGSTYYQWGRKDPLVALKNRELHNKEDYRLHEVGQDGYGYRTETKTVSLGEAIQHPNVFYTTSNTYYCWLSNPIYNLWNTNSPENPNITNPTKTLYDPSPRGFKIPPSKAFARFVNGNAASSGGTLNGRIVTPGVQYEVRINSAGTTIPLTATGQRVDRKSGIDGIEEGGLWAMDGVYYWTCYGVTNSIGTILGHSLCIRDGANTYTYQFPGAQTMARPVRPIRE